MEAQSVENSDIHNRTPVNRLSGAVLLLMLLLVSIAGSWLVKYVSCRADLVINALGQPPFPKLDLFLNIWCNKLPECCSAVLLVTGIFCWIRKRYGLLLIITTTGFLFWLLLLGLGLWSISYQYVPVWEAVKLGVWLE